MPKKQKTIKVSTLKLNPNNPSVLIKDKFHKLVNSIKDFSKMMTIREMVFDENLIALGGNKRLLSVKELILMIKDDERIFENDPDLREILLKEEIPSSWVKIVDGLTEKEKREFSVKDNVGFGLWDWDILSNEEFFDPDELDDWGVDFPEYKETDYSSKNGEIDADDLDDKMKIVLEYTFDDYQKIKEELSMIGGTPEEVFYNLLFDHE